MDYPLDFYRSVFFTLMWEGGYVNDPDDPGGETKFGISKRSFPNLDIKELKVDDAIYIYFTKYWNMIQGDRIPSPLSSLVFDFAVNAGVPRAVKCLQELVGAKKDGIVGNETLSKVLTMQRFVTRKKLCNDYLQKRLDFYDNLIERNHKFSKFERGWKNRVKSIKGAFLL